MSSDLGRRQVMITTPTRVYDVLLGSNSKTGVYARACCFFFQAEDGIRDLVRSRGLGDVDKRQISRRHDRGAPVIDREPGALCRAERRDPPGAELCLSLIHI